MAETMPSSVRVGVRPMSATKRSYSSGLSPCSLTRSAVISTSLRIRVSLVAPSAKGIVCSGCDQTLEQPAPVGAADQVVDEVLRMRHHPEHIEPVGINARD